MKRITVFKINKLKHIR